LQPVRSVTLVIADDQGNALRSQQDVQILGGKSVSLSLNADTDLTASQGYAQIHAFTLTPAKTVMQLETRVTFPQQSPLRVR
jgi:hypothetical protein